MPCLKKAFRLLQLSTVSQVLAALSAFFAAWRMADSDLLMSAASLILTMSMLILASTLRDLAYVTAEKCRQ